MTEETPSLKIKRSKSPVLSLDPRYLDIITTLNDKVIAEAFKEKDIPTCLSLLQQLEHSVKNGQYGTYSSSKKHQHYHLFVYQHNLAMVHQENNDNHKAKDHLQKAINSYQQIQGFITNREENLVFTAELAKLQLQYCGLLSHCDMHQQAAVLSEKSLDKIIETSRILQAVCYEQSILNSQRDTTCSSRQKGVRNELVNFKSIVIEEAENLLQELAHLPLPHKLLNDDKGYFQGIISKIFSWKENQTNNEAAIRKQFKLQPEKNSRSILGLQKQTICNEFQIGTFMTLTFKLIGYSPHPDPLRLLSSHYLKQLAFHSAVAYFTMATESRFSQPDLSEMRGNMKIDQKYQKLNHDERLLKCKILHLKALEVAGRLLPSGNSLFSHLANSFTRNYKFVMDQIGQVSQANSTHLIDKHNQIDEPPIQAQYGIRVTPLRHTRKNQSKLDNSKMKKGEEIPHRSKSQHKLRSFSNKKKSSN